MIDSHSHIYTPRFDEDRTAVIQRAIQVGVKQLLQVGCNLEESRAVVKLAEQIAGIYASVGVHPHDADTVNADVLNQLVQLAQHPKVVAWGEIGLDFYYDNSPREVQIKAFEEQIRYPNRLGLPVVIHTRDAEDETLEILRNNPVEKGGHVHCFTGSLPLSQSLLELGFHIGFTGILTFKNAEDLREVVRHVPLTRILIETDSPYLAPSPIAAREMNLPLWSMWLRRLLSSSRFLWKRFWKLLRPIFMGYMANPEWNGKYCDMTEAGV